MSMFMLNSEALNILNREALNLKLQNISNETICFIYSNDITIIEL